MTERVVGGGPAATPPLHVMSWNVRRPVPHLRRSHPDRWEIREPRLRAVLAAERPHLLGAQEVVPSSARVLLDALGAGYRLLGRGRGANGSGEACPVLVDERRLEVLGWRQVALSATPGRAGTRRLGDMAPRVAVVVDLRDRTTGGDLMHVNVHLDPLTARSRLLAAHQLRALIADAGVPVLLTGDANTGLSSPPHRALTDGGALQDLFGRDDVGTFNRYRAPRPGRRIDWLLTSPELEVTHAWTGTDAVDGGWASDHLPVHAELRHAPRTADPPAIGQPRR